MSTYIVMDLEWNQCPRGKEYSVEQLPSEIIEIGAVKLNEKMQVLSQYHELVRPQVYKSLHYMAAKVTHLSIRELKAAGKPFDKVAGQFLAWCGKDYRFCTWGPADLLEFQRNLAYYGVRNCLEYPLYYYDIQKIYSLHIGDEKAKPALDHAIEALKIRVDRSFHRALGDAYYTGQVMKAINFNKWGAYISVDYYQPPKCEEEEIHLEFPTYTKDVSRIYSSRTEMLADKKLMSVRCRRCGRKLRKKIQWFPVNQKQYVCLAFCPEHGYIRGKLRVKKVDEERVFVVKTLKPADEESILRIREKKMEQRRKRQKFLRKLRKKKEESAAAEI